jgi:hypothetical protein
MDWGRYAELFSYDEPSGEIFIEDSIEDSAIADNDIEVEESN